MPNITGEDGNFTLKVQNTQPVAIVAFFATLNILFSITAILGNVLILIALHKVTSIYPPTKLLFRCLAVTDLSIGLISQPLYAVDLVHVGITNSDENIVDYARLLCCLLWSISDDIHRNKCGQTSRAVVGAEIQTCCDIKASSSGHYLLLVIKYCITWVLPIFKTFWLCIYCFAGILSAYLGLLLHQDLCPSPPPTVACTGPCSPTTTGSKQRRSDCIECGTIQENGFHHSLGTARIILLLFSLYCCSSYGNVWIQFLYNLFCNFIPSFNPSLLKLLSEPNSLLLEDQRSQTRSEGRNYTIKLLLSTKLNCPADLCAVHRDVYLCFWN